MTAHRDPGDREGNEYDADAKRHEEAGSATVHSQLIFLVAVLIVGHLEPANQQQQDDYADRYAE